MSAQILFHLALNMERKSMLQQTWNFTTILSMAITDGEEMTMFQTHDMWRGDISILICFVRVVSSDSTLCCERKLGHDVANLVRWLRALGLLSCCSCLVCLILYGRCWNRLPNLMLRILQLTALIPLSLIIPFLLLTGSTPRSWACLFVNVVSNGGSLFDSRIELFI